MVEVIRACIDLAPPPKSHGERMALVQANQWHSNDAIVISFMDGEAILQERVKKQAQTWTTHANLRLFFRQDPRADIRISFLQEGSWSHLGTACRNVPRDKPTMNFGWLKPDSPEDEVARVVLHEFGHALSCIHEHSHPEGGIKWNKPAVYEYFAGPPNYWTKEEVDHNLFAIYDKTLTNYSKLDPASIMMYPIPQQFTEDGFSVGLNRELSVTDKSFIRKMYP